MSSELSAEDIRPKQKPWDRSPFVRGAAIMACILSGLFILRLIFPALAYPPSGLAAFIRDASPGGLVTAGIEAAVRLGRKTGLGFLEHAGVPALIILTHAIWLAAGGLAAAFVRARSEEGSRGWRSLAAATCLFAAAVWTASAGSSKPSGIATMIYAGAFLAFARASSGVPILSFQSTAVEPGETPLDAMVRSRRRFLRRSAAALAAMAGGAAVFRHFRKPDPSQSVRISSPDARFSVPPPDPAFERIRGLTPEITPAEEFYNVDIDINKPSVDHRTWRLRVDGNVDRPLSLDFAALQDRFAVLETACTLCCISNEVGGDLISTAIWRGVRLKDVLAEAGLRPGSVDVIFRAADGYSDSVPIAKALEDDTMIAFGMNGAALPKANGFPARMVIPGIYGMKNVKWLTAIEVSDQNYRGYWQRRGWSDLAVVKTQSRIDVPSSGSAVPAVFTAAGLAWAGDRGISRVELSQDGGKTWHPARLKRELAPNAWRSWAARLTASAGGRRLLVRATDGRGSVQGARRTRTHPDGASGLDSVSFRSARGS